MLVATGRLVCILQHTPWAIHLLGGSRTRRSVQPFIERDRDPVDVRFGEQLLDAVVADGHLDSGIRTQRVEHVQYGRQFLFGQEVDLQLEAGSPLRQARHVVLRQQYDTGEEDRFQRDDQVQQAERKPIERGSGGVQPDPPRKPDGMEHDERHASGGARDLAGQPIDGRLLVEHSSIEFGHRSNVVRDWMFHVAGPVVVGVRVSRGRKAWCSIGDSVFSAERQDCQCAHICPDLVRCA